MMCLALFAASVHLDCAIGYLFEFVQISAFRFEVNLFQFRLVVGAVGVYVFPKLLESLVASSRATTFKMASRSPLEICAPRTLSLLSPCFFWMVKKLAVRVLPDSIS